jgi:hypothetical protein
LAIWKTQGRLVLRVISNKTLSIIHLAEKIGPALKVQTETAK